jgi:hypothetical protein
MMMIKSYLLWHSKLLATAAHAFTTCTYYCLILARVCLQERFGDNIIFTLFIVAAAALWHVSKQGQAKS